MPGVRGGDGMESRQAFMWSKPELNGKGMNGKGIILKSLFPIPLPFIPLP